MKILFITDNFPPEVNAPATRTFAHCKEWVKDDVEVTVITCAPNFPHGKVYNGYKNKFYQTEMIEGIKVIRVWSYIAENKGFLRRTLDYMSFAFSSFIAGLFVKTDVIIATSPQFFTTWSASMLSTLKRRPWIFELRDIWPASIRTVGALKKESILDFFEKIEIFLYHNADGIVAVTKSFKTELVSRGIDPNKIDVITNGADLSLYNIENKDQSLLSELGLNDKFIIGYVGTHGMAHSLDFVVNSIAEIEDEEIHFLFIGNGAEKKNIMEIADKLGLKNITFLDSVPKQETVKYLSIIDVSLSPLKKSEVFKGVIPSKIFEAAAMKKPILLGVEGEAAGIIKRYNSGLCYEPENKKDFLEKIDLLKKDKELYTELQKGCEVMSKDFDRKALADSMLEIVRSKKLLNQ
ncbi:glycosyltransferase family 4 protein [Sulfurovum sp. AR]|uniref:glycosyltransferase family 4 protein n=1 Tax=Sulfurovum sp. AR TaxID=1165841 RepID=UPI00025C47B6|nr:glycosyltransferase family 4 protein [Sulfurovum sp. AR]EIF51214.1 group 1 glycosyl transferase [Sulfurovum sp. AR]